MVPVDLAVSEAAPYSHHEYVLSQFGTHTDMTIDVPRTFPVSPPTSCCTICTTLTMLTSLDDPLVNTRTMNIVILVVGQHISPRVMFIHHRVKNPSGGT